MAKRNDNPKVYLATFPNGKQYVGITTATLEIRKSEHESRARNGSNYAVHNAIRKYGDPTWEVLNICSSYEEAKELERKYIKELNTLTPNGYNLTIGGDGSKGHKLSEEQRKKLSDAHTGYVMPESQKRNISLGNKGKSKSHAKKIKRIDLITKEVKIYNNYLEIKQENIFTKSEVYRAINGQRSSHKGFRWEWVA